MTATPNSTNSPVLGGSGVAGSAGAVVGVDGSTGARVGVDGSMGAAVGVDGSIGARVGADGSMGAAVGVVGSTGAAVGGEAAPEETVTASNKIEGSSSHCDCRSHHRTMRQIHATISSLIALRVQTPSPAIAHARPIGISLPQHARCCTFVPILFCGV